MKIPVYLQCPNREQDFVRVCYYNSTSNSTQGKPIPTGGYNNIEAQSGARAKYVPIPGGVNKPSQSQITQRQGTTKLKHDV